MTSSAICNFLFLILRIQKIFEQVVLTEYFGVCMNLYNFYLQYYSSHMCTCMWYRLIHTHTESEGSWVGERRTDDQTGGQQNRIDPQCVLAKSKMCYRLREARHSIKTHSLLKQAQSLRDKRDNRDYLQVPFFLSLSPSLSPPPAPPCHPLLLLPLISSSLTDV